MTFRRSVSASTGKTKRAVTTADNLGGLAPYNSSWGSGLTLVNVKIARFPLIARLKGPLQTVSGTLCGSRAVGRVGIRVTFPIDDQE
jgi:hypothetical protein